MRSQKKNPAYHQFQSQFLCGETNTTHFQHKHQATAGVFMAFTFYVIRAEYI